MRRWIFLFSAVPLPPPLHGRKEGMEEKSLQPNHHYQGRHTHVCMYKAFSGDFPSPLPLPPKNLCVCGVWEVPAPKGLPPVLGWRDIIY